jgi:hypothetical protein
VTSALLPGNLLQSKQVASSLRVVEMEELAGQSPFAAVWAPREKLAVSSYTVDHPPVALGALCQ